MYKSYSRPGLQLQAIESERMAMEPTSAGQAALYVVDLPDQLELVSPARTPLGGLIWNINLNLTPVAATTLIMGLVELDLCTLIPSGRHDPVVLADRGDNILTFDPVTCVIELHLAPAVAPEFRRSVAAQTGRTLLTVAGLCGLWDDTRN